jgi:type I restriction enzyme M protein
MNKYRVYALADLQLIQSRLPLGDDQASAPDTRSLDARSTRSLISRLHSILRDQDSHSNIIERFDELTKLLFLKISTEPDMPDLLDRRPQEGDETYAARIRNAYTQVANKREGLIPKAFSALEANAKALCECAGTLAQVSFKDVSFDVKGLAYEEVVKNTFDKNDNQQFFTPPTIVKFMVEMMRSNLQGDICDPAAPCGNFEGTCSVQNPNSVRD